MSKLDHPAYGAHSLEPHTKTNITYSEAIKILELCVQTVLCDRAFGDKEYIWFDQNDKQVAVAYQADKFIDICFMDYEIDRLMSEQDKRYLLVQSQITNIQFNDSGRQ
jgi:hypothetical protein